MVNYILYAFDSIYYVMNSVVIPIPVSSHHVYYFSLFSLFIALIVVGVIWFFFSKVFEVDFHFWRSGERSSNSSSEYIERKRKQGREELGNKRKK